MVVCRNVDLKSDRLLVEMIQAQINSRAEPTKLADGTKDYQNPEETYVSYIFPLFSDLSRMCKHHSDNCHKISEVTMSNNNT